MPDEHGHIEARAREAGADRDDAEHLEWEDVAPTAERLFQFWQDKTGELAWAKRSWEVLAAAGLTRWANGIERLKAELRLLVLAAIYHGFYFAIEGLEEEPSYAWWLEELEPDPFILGRLCEREVSPNVDDDLSDVDFASHLVEARHAEVIEALVAGYDGWQGLFFALSDSAGGSCGAVPHEELRAYHWVVEGGCPI